MGASTVTGKGMGASGTPTLKDLAILANGPSILVAGRVHVLASMSSPPSLTGSVSFPTPLPGSPDDYVVILTPLNAESAYVAQMIENDDGNFSGFLGLASSECDVMYIVTKNGQRPNV